MPQELNRDPTGQGASGASWDNSGSGSHQGSGSTPGLGAVQDTVARAKEEAARLSSEAARQAKAQARSLGEEAKERAARYAEGGKEVVTEHLDSFAQAIRKAGEELSERDQTMAAQVVRQAARGLESLSRSVGGTTFEDVIDSVRRFGRSHPAAFVGGAVLAGWRSAVRALLRRHNPMTTVGGWGRRSRSCTRGRARGNQTLRRALCGSAIRRRGRSFAPPSRARARPRRPAPAQAMRRRHGNPRPRRRARRSSSRLRLFGGSEPGAISRRHS